LGTTENFFPIPPYYQILVGFLHFISGLTLVHTFFYFLFLVPGIGPQVYFFLTKPLAFLPLCTIPFSDYQVFLIGAPGSSTSPNLPNTKIRISKENQWIFIMGFFHLLGFSQIWSGFLWCGLKMGGSNVPRLVPIWDHPISGEPPPVFERIVTPFLGQLLFFRAGINLAGFVPPHGGVPFLPRLFFFRDLGPPFWFGVTLGLLNPLGGFPLGGPLFFWRPPFFFWGLCLPFSLVGLLSGDFPRQLLLLGGTSSGAIPFPRRLGFPPAGGKPGA